MKDSFRLAPEQWTTLRRLLDQALDLPPREREAWLASLDAQHAEYRPRLRSLLANADDGPGAAPHPTVARLLDTLPRVETAQFAVQQRGDADALQAGAAVGPYRLIRPLGEGGMGEVWLAERTDVLQKRQVALKLPRLMTGRAALAERFAREREILATLEHPNIARLYDAGLADGQPWLALEYVEGERIDAWCARKALDVPARLRLFLQVARAVAHAHANLVVHRDLKPSNILVTEAGDVRLLDFGIAKLLDDGRAQETELTQLSGRALTPEYAAPEQILGQPIGTATDVYALGVVLFELLSGTRPYRLKRDSRAALEEAIVQADVQRPSAVATDRRLKQRLRGDLDTIVLKALKKAPAQRYGTVAAFADDIERYLAQRPVTAQPDSAAYRLRKFLLRNRTAAGAAATTALALLAGTGVAAWQAHAARAEQRRAEEARRFIESVFVDADPYGQSGRKLTAVELLRQAQARLPSLVDAGPQIRADLLNTLATSMLNLEDLPAAREVLEAAAREAAALDAGHRQAVRTERLRARLRMLDGQAAEARATLDRLAALLRAGAPRHEDELLAVLLARTEAENAALDWAAAEASAVEALQLAEWRGDSARVERISALLQLAHAHDRRNHSQAALDAARRAHELAAAAFPTVGSHPIVNSARAMYAAALWDVDEQDRAVDLMRESRRDAIAVFGPDSQIAGQHAQRMAVYLTSTGYTKEALAAAEEAMRILGPTYPPDSLAYAALLEARASALLGVHRPAEALAEATRAREIIVARLGDNHEQAHIMQAYRARALSLLGRLDEATRILETTIERYRKTGYSTVAAPTYLLGVTWRMAGDPARALELQQQAFGAVRKGPTARRWGSRVLIEIGLNRLALNDAAGARAPLTEALAIVEEKFRAPTPLLANARLGLARVELADGRPQAALPLLEAADAFWRDTDPQGRSAGEAAYWLARCLQALGRHSEARLAGQRAAARLARSPFPVDARLVQAARGT